MKLIQEIRNIINNGSRQTEIVVPICDESRSAITANNNPNVGTEVFPLLSGLRNNLVFGKANATIIHGANSNINVPKFSGNKANWKGETVISEENSIQFGDITLTPKRLTATLTISNLWLIQDSNEANEILKEDLITAICEKLESTILGNSEVTNDKPEGFFYGYEEESPNSYETIVEMENELDSANVPNFNRSFILSPTTKKYFKLTPTEVGSGRYVYEKNKILSTQTFTTNSMLENGVIYGNFEDLIIAIFGDLIITVDPYSKALNGETILTINFYVDCKPRRKESFSKRLISYEEVLKSTVTVDMLNEWGLNDYQEAELDGFKVYESMSNYNIHSARAKVRIYLDGMKDFTFKYRSDGESNSDYVIVSKLDTELQSSDSGYTTLRVQYHTSGKQSQWFDASYSWDDEEQHFIEIVYLKDFSGSVLQDRGFIAIPKQYKIVELNAKLPPQPIIVKGKFTDDSTSSDWWYYKNGFESSSNKVNISEFVNPNTKEFEVEIGKTESLKILDSLFYNNSKLERIDEISVDEGITSISYMFYQCSALQSIDASDCNVGSVTNMSRMFYNCSALQSIDVSNWNTEKVTNMNNMFYNCSALQTLDLSNWNTEKVTDMGYMFYYCSALQSIDVSNWNTEKVTDMGNMFGGNWSGVVGCTLLTEIKGLQDWNVENVTNMKNMFGGCQSIQTLELSNWNTEKVTDMNDMFNSCYALQTINGTIFNIKVNLSLSSCSKLNKPTVLMLLNGLADVGETRTITFNSAITLTPEEAAIATSKGWTISGAKIQ